MARRRLLIGDDRRRLFDPPADQAGIIANYTLSADDIEVIGRRYGAPNRLGLACHIALIRHPGFGFPYSADVPDAILGYLAAQLFVDPEVFAAYGGRPSAANPGAVDRGAGASHHGVAPHPLPSSHQHRPRRGSKPSPRPTTAYAARRPKPRASPNQPPSIMTYITTSITT